MERYFYTIDEIKDLNSEKGFHFFDKDTRRFFKSRVGGTVYGGRYFITSEELTLFDDLYDDPRDEPRRWTVRRAKSDGRIETVSEYGQFASREEAKRFINKLLREEGEK